MANQMIPPNRAPWPPLICAAGILLGTGLWVFYPLPWIGEPLSDILFAVGAVAIAGVVAVDVSALLTLRRADTTVMPHRAAKHLVTDGPYSFTRNPIYLGYVVLTAALGLVSGNLWLLPLAVIVAYAITKVAVEAEEKHLAARFGKRYRDYAARVRRWI
jgi:protein-S-isoprenylcysteine O-methyltransferase Ste14